MKTISMKDSVRLRTVPMLYNYLDIEARVDLMFHLTPTDVCKAYKNLNDFVVTSLQFYQAAGTDEYSANEEDLFYSNKLKHGCMSAW